MPINTSESLKPGGPGEPLSDVGVAKQAAPRNEVESRSESKSESKRKAESKSESKRASEKAPEVEADKSPASSGDELGRKTREYIEKQDTVEVYIPRVRGTQTVQINGVNFRVPAGQKVEVAEDVFALLKSSGALVLPPEV